MLKKEIYDAAIEKWGVDRQVDKAIEEMAELIKALLKCRSNCNEKTTYEVLEEIADTDIMIEQLKGIFCISNNYEEVNKIKLEKIERLKQLVK